MPSRSHRPNAPPEPPITREQAAIASKVLHKAWDCGHELGAAQLTQAEKDRIVAEINSCVNTRTLFRTPLRTGCPTHAPVSAGGGGLR